MDFDLTLKKLIEDSGGEITNPLPLFRQLSSLQLVELLVRIEKEFQIEISPIEYDPRQFENYASIAKMIQNKTKKKNTP